MFTSSFEGEGMWGGRRGYTRLPLMFCTFAFLIFLTMNMYFIIREKYWFYKVPLLWLRAASCVWAWDRHENYKEPKNGQDNSWVSSEQDLGSYLADLPDLRDSIEFPSFLIIELFYSSVNCRELRVMGMTRSYRQMNFVPWRFNWYYSVDVDKFCVCQHINFSVICLWIVSF